MLPIIPPTILHIVISQPLPRNLEHLIIPIRLVTSYPSLPFAYPTSFPASSVTPYPAHHPYNPSVNPANYAHYTHAYSPYSSEQHAVYAPPVGIYAPEAAAMYGPGGNIIYTPQAAVPSIPPALPATPFGKDLWEKHIGEVGVEPPIQHPRNPQQSLPILAG